MADFRILASLAVLLGLLSFSPAAVASHVQCGDAIATDTTLDGDLTCAGDGLTVTMSNVTLDLNGHTIHGSGGGTGVYVVTAYSIDALRDVVIRDGTISGFRTGIETDGASRPTTRGMVLERNGAGYHCSYASGCRIEDSVMRGNGTGVSMLSADDRPDEPGVIKRNLFEGNRVGVALSGYPATVADNRVVQNVAQGIAIDYGATGEVTVSRNVIAGNGEEGVLVVFQATVTISDNRIERNRGAGVRIDWEVRAEVRDNRITGNGGDGILVEHRPTAVIEGNRTDRNGDDGIDIDPFSEDCCGDVIVRANRAFFNADLGIEAIAGETTDGGGNKARHNGNPAQCVGVSCK